MASGPVQDNFGEIIRKSARPAASSEVDRYDLSTQARQAGSWSLSIKGLSNGGVYGAVNLPTVNVPVEAKVGATALPNRKELIIKIGNNGMFWGLDSSVTITSGVPTNNGDLIIFEIDPTSTFQVWVVGNTNNKNMHVVEIP